MSGKFLLILNFTVLQLEFIMESMKISEKILQDLKTMNFKIMYKWIYVWVYWNVFYLLVDLCDSNKVYEMYVDAKEYFKSYILYYR